MAINLTKGGNTSIGNIQKFVVGMGWDVDESDSGTSYDLDASAFMLNAKGKLISDEHFIFYKNLKSPEGCLEHTGDNKTGIGDGDDESILVDLSKIPNECDSIVFVVTIYEGEAKKQNFGQVRNSFVRIYDPVNGEDIVRFDLGEDFSVETAVEFGSLYKRDNTWKFRAVGTGYSGGLQKFVDKYCQ